MAVIPSGTPDPWQWARYEADQNNALYRMFEQDRMRREAAAEQEQYRMAATQQQQAYQTGRDERQQQWQTGEREDDRNFQRELAETYGVTGARGTGTTPASLTPEVVAAAPQLRAIEAKYGLPARLLDTKLVLENGGGANIQRNKNSTASGYFQFIDGTANQYGLTDRNNLLQAADAAARLAADNRKQFLAITGREPTVGDYYFMHQQGTGKLARAFANPSEKAALIFGADAVFNNMGKRANYNVTSQQFMDMWRNKAMRVHAMWDQAQQNANQGQGNGTVTPTGQPTSGQAAQGAQIADSQRQPSASGVTPAGTNPPNSGMQPAEQKRRKAKLVGTGPDGVPRYALEE